MDKRDKRTHGKQKQEGETFAWVTGQLLGVDVFQAGRVLERALECSKLKKYYSSIRFTPAPAGRRVPKCLQRNLHSAFGTPSCKTRWSVA